MSILIENALVVRNPLTGDFAPGLGVAVEGADIQSVGPTEELRNQFPAAERLDAKGMLLLPGLIDAHTHLYAALTLGMPGASPAPRNFPQILKRVWWRWDKALDQEDNLVSALAGSIASLRNGITTLFDHHASPRAVPDSLSCVAAGVEQVGLRACLAYEVSDRDGDASRDRGIAENCRFITAQKAKQGTRTQGLFGLHAVYSLSDDTLRRCAEHAVDLQAGCHMHMAEHQAEVFKFAETHDESIAEFLARIGLLGPKTLVAHTVHLDADGAAILKETGTFNVHNPKSNMGNGVGICPVTEMLSAQQPVGLGSDGFYDIPQELVTAKLLQTLGAKDPSAFSDQLALQMVYGHNVQFAQRVLGRPLGQVAPGSAADLILVSYDPMTPLRRDNLANHLVAALNSHAVKTVLVDGRMVMKDSEILGIDEPQVLALAKDKAEKIWARL